MQRQGDETHFETDEARGASSPNIVRWVLGISLFAAIALLSAIWIFGAATQNEVEGAGTADGRQRALQDYGSAGGVLSSEGDDSDSIVSEDADELPAPAATNTASVAQPAAPSQPQE